MTTHPEGLTRRSAQETNVGAPHGAIRARQGEADAAAVMTTGGGVGPTPGPLSSARAYLREWFGEEGYSVLHLRALKELIDEQRAAAPLTDRARIAIRQAANILFNLEQESGPGSSLEPRQRACCREVREQLDALTNGERHGS